MSERLRKAFVLDSLDLREGIVTQHDFFVSSHPAGG